MNIATTTGTAHARTARLGIREIVRRLNAALGATLVAALSGSKDRKISYKWAQQDGPTPNAHAVKRLQFAYAQWILISEAEGEHVARMWFIGANPWLDHDSPVDAIRSDKYRETAAAAAAMVDDGFID
ncbi:hypothetical protein [Pseudarthrobacter sp. PS3-L1]|uniref:hypothetical protein n=1 Tax=Pseudarthrobacter sp. PS3-L1 TaxID=3046207 RepID=UPI0024BB74CE|nr:hypothetical protein [Pseudarthrobacter sp. PS3-L1]MDJ0318935.1 hypothetical protein [Pseudarthrobacter sp. PS3-L1]